MKLRGGSSGGTLVSPNVTDDPFGDPRVAALYDGDNPPGDDHVYFRALADRIDATTIVDLGCGTGLLTVSFTDGRSNDSGLPGGSGAERTVYGVDPSPAMLDVARARDSGDRVHWQPGDASVLGSLVADGSVDLVTMTGNVAQHIIGADWPRTLESVARALRPGGLVAFETRNPAARGWQSWNRENTYGSRDTPAGRLTEWMDVTSVEDGIVSFTAHNVWEATGEHQPLQSRLQFRTQGQLVQDLTAAGLTPASFDGGWHGEPVTDSSRLFVITAAKSAPTAASS